MKNTLFNLTHNRLLTAVNIFICLILLISLLFFFRELLSYFYKSSKQVSIAASPVKQQEALKNFNDYETIIKNNPFGIQEPGLKLLSSSEGRQASISDIKLVGTLSGHHKYAFAIFSDKNNRQETIRVGEKVFDYGILKRVEKDKAVIQNDSRILEIPLHDILKIQEITGARDNAQASGLVKSLSSSTYAVDKKRILHAIDNPNELMTDARLQPNFIDGRQEGFILREVKNNGIYQNLGLQNGDVLLRINEYSIANPETALQAFYAMKGLDTIQLDIVRNGNRMTMTYLIK